MTEIRCQKRTSGLSMLKLAAALGLVVPSVFGCSGQGGISASQDGPSPGDKPASPTDGPLAEVSAGPDVPSDRVSMDAPADTKVADAGPAVDAPRGDDADPIVDAARLDAGPTIDVTRPEVGPPVDASRFDADAAVDAAMSGADARVDGLASDSGGTDSDRANLSILGIAAGTYHVCALINHGVQCWGSNMNGELGDGSTIDRSFPGPVTGLASDVSAIAAGHGYSCALLNEGTVRCWGLNHRGQVGDGTSGSLRVLPVAVTGLPTTVSAIATGQYHACAVLEDGGVRCWGSNDSGQLGDGSKTERPVPVPVAGLDAKVTALALGEYHSCALLIDGRVQCWGDGAKLGNDSTDVSLHPVTVSNLVGAVSAIAATENHTCALLVDGRVQCWGYYDYGKLGNGTTSGGQIPVAVKGLTAAASAIATGANHTCALLKGGAVQCWGSNLFGELGDGTLRAERTMNEGYAPVTVKGLTIAPSFIAAGSFYTCSATSDGIRCWGTNGFGQLGTGVGGTSPVPVTVSGLTTTVDAIASGRDHTCALLGNGQAQCWGENELGQHGNGTIGRTNAPGAPVQGLAAHCTGITAGASHTCAWTDDGTAQCWGLNSYGQLGLGSITDSWSPVAVTDLATSVSAMKAQDFSTCALLNGGGARCWGLNNSGQLGDGSTDDRHVPASVTGLAATPTAIAMAANHTCALLNTGGVQCWGVGRLGDGTNATDAVRSAVVTGLTSVVALAAGEDYTCAVLKSGEVQCWGANWCGQLGSGSTVDGLVPSQIIGLTAKVSAIAAGDLHACALLDGGGVQCWGRNDSGQLGNGSTENSYVPVSVTGLAATATALSAGSSHTCALLKTGVVQCWGQNALGQLGDGSGFSAVPREVRLQ